MNKAKIIGGKMKRLALCIGNNKYENLGELKYAKNDAEAISYELSKLGFETTCKVDLSRDDMIREITNYINKLKDYDSGVFYYAGHGFQSQGENYLAPVDFPNTYNNGEAEFYAYPLVNLMKHLEGYIDKTKVFIFDACRTNINDRGSNRGFAPIYAPRGSIIAFATSSGMPSKENPQHQHGEYTKVLLKNISLPRVSIETVFKKTREDMSSSGCSDQIPWEHTSLIGDYFLNPNTIYDTIHYGDLALQDKFYNSKFESVASIIRRLKSRNWYEQNPAIQDVYNLEFDHLMADDIFVIGRNIYQAANGRCNQAEEFIRKFSVNSLKIEAKFHLLNGMAYEIYFSSTNEIRRNPKNNFYLPILELLEKEENYGSKEFIKSVLSIVNEKLLYIPGENEIMEFFITLDSRNKLTGLYYKGKNVLCVSTEKNEQNEFEGRPISPTVLKSFIAKNIVAPNDYVSLENIPEELIIVPLQIELFNM